MEITPEFVRACFIVGAMLTAAAALVELRKGRRKSGIAALIGAVVMGVGAYAYEGGLRRPEIITAVATAVTGIAALAAAFRREHKSRS